MRWWNRASAARGAFFRAARGIFFRKDDGARAIWKLVLAYALYLLWTYAAAALLSLGFGALFDAWNLNARTVALAPPWARWLAANYGRLISMVSSLGALALSHLLVRWMTGGRPQRLGARAFGVGALAGVLTVALGAGLFLLLDSMRPMERALALSWDVLWMAAVFLFAALSEERFARTLVMRISSLRARPYWAYIASAAVFMALTGSWALGAWGMPNMLLMGLICAHASARGRAGMSVGFRFAWSFAANALIGFPGGATGARSLVSLYAVSENWLTGGERGLICGLWMTAALLALAALLLLPDVLRRRRLRAGVGGEEGLQRGHGAERVRAPKVV